VFVQPQLEKIIAAPTVKELLMKKVALADMQIVKAKQAFHKQFNLHNHYFIGAAVSSHSRKTLP
jgi:hypothetical protein